MCYKEATDDYNGAKDRFLCATQARGIVADAPPKAGLERIARPFAGAAREGARQKKIK
jgi:hypothetical protein